MGNQILSMKFLKHTSLFVSALMLSIACYAQDEDATVLKQFVIIASTKNYGEALSNAQKAKTALSYTINLRNLKQHNTNGLTNNKKECEDDGFEYPCYIFRGRWDDGEYVSIEWSNSFDNLKQGYYIVVVYSGSKQLPTLKMQRVKKAFPSAYVLKSKVYLGCIH